MSGDHNMHCSANNPLMLADECEESAELWLKEVNTRQKAAIELRRLNDEIEQLRKENAELRTIMMAAAKEITSQWEAHCDEEGYGPVNLINKLENTIVSDDQQQKLDYQFFR